MSTRGSDLNAGTTPFQARFWAEPLTLAGANASLDQLTATIAGSRLDLNPHQIDAALFALRSPLSQGVMLADEVGLGKTIEAGLVILQRWAERKRRILLVLPATLRVQWQRELAEKFGLPAVILEAASANRLRKSGQRNPFDQAETIVIVSRDLSTDAERRLEVTDLASERRLEDHLVHLLLDAPEIDYDSHAKLLYKLSGQVVGKLRSYLPDDDAIRNVLRAHRRTFVELIRAQMQTHSFEEVASYEHRVAEGWIRLDAGCLEGEEGVDPRDYRLPAPDDKSITEIIYCGFTKCVYPRQKFHSDPERIFAVVCERDTSVLKWMKPFRVQFPIHLRNGRNYEPDFVIETDVAKLLVEVKRRTDLTSAKVLENKNAAAIWCGYASQDAKTKGLKPWRYLLIPHDEVKEATDMAGYVAEFTVQPEQPKA